METLFVRLDTTKLAELIRHAKESICYAGPGIHLPPAQAIAEAARRHDPPVVTVCLDFCENSLRLGFGDLEAVRVLSDAGIVVNSAPGLRAALLIVDGNGFMFTPNALYLESDTTSDGAPNAMRLGRDQVSEVLARFSPAAKAIAKAMAATPTERQRIENLPVEVNTEPVTQSVIKKVADRLDEAPPVAFDVARQVRVYYAYLQYVELKLVGAAIHRHRLAMPPALLALGQGDDLEGRWRTTFDLIQRDSELSSKKLEGELRLIRDNFTRSLGKDHGRVLLKSQKERFALRIKSLKAKLEAHQKKVVAKLQETLDTSREQIVEHYVPLATRTPPDALLGQISRTDPTADDVRRWIDSELDLVFPDAKSLISKMELNVRYKDVTIETLRAPDFGTAIKLAFPGVDWERAHREFLAASEAGSKEQRS